MDIRCLMLFAFLVSGISHATTGPPRVITSSGTVEGVIEDSNRVFRGIPYVAPPIANLRWRAPQPAPAWEGVREAKEYGPICPQMRPGKREQSENCLTLNVTAPAIAENLPVMLWIHGGANVNGSGNINGGTFARDGIVLVSLNYRLGRFGVFSHPALSLEAQELKEPTGNFGVLDQIAGLKWIKRNIAAFGGDPNRVTIFGVSAGGTHVNHLMASPLATGLFHGAIAQSGANGMSNPQRMPGTEQIGITVEKSRGVKGIDDLRQLAWQDLVDTRPSYRAQSRTFIDGQVLTDAVPEVFRKGQQNNVPYIAGANSFEGSLSRVISSDPIRRALQENIGTIAPVYGRQPDDPMLYLDFYGDVVFVGPTRYLVSQMQSVESAAWNYHMGYVMDELNGKIPGTPHGGEVMYVFDFLKEVKITRAMSTFMKIPAGRYRASENDYAMAKTLHGYWVQFAKTGNPNVDNLPEWPEYSIKSDATLLIGNDGITVERSLRRPSLDAIQAEYELRRGVAPNPVGRIRTGTN